MKLSASMKKKYALLLVFCLVLSIFGSILSNDKISAAETIDISVDTSTKTGENKTDIQIEPENYNNQSELANAGVIKLNINLNISSFTGNNMGTPGVMIYFWDGSNWNNKWYDLTYGDMSLSFDISSYLNGNSSVNYGIQFSNISNVTYSITSANLTIGESSSSIGNIQVENNYAKLLELSLYLYDANMCGSDVDDDCALTWRHNCHTFDEKATYNGQEVDVSGGFHDAGDFVKFGLPAGYTATILGLSYYEFKDAYIQTGTGSHLEKITNHFAKYFKKCIVRDKNTQDVIAFAFQCGDGDIDHNYWNNPESQSLEQRGGVFFADSSTPATDHTSEAVSALVLQYLNFNDETYLQAAKDLFDFAKDNEKATVSIAAVSNFYNSSDWVDDYCLAAALLYKATKDDNYKSEYNKYKSGLNADTCLSWDRVDPLAKFYGENDQSALKTSYTNMKNSGNELESRFKVINDWGSARYNCNIQMLGLLYDKYSNSTSGNAWAKVQMDYILGNNSFNKCFVTGYSENSSKYPHHRASSGYTGGSKGTTSQKYCLLGALVGGPIIVDETLDGFYADTADDYCCNEVALDYNAGLVFSAAALYLANKNDGNQSLLEPSNLSGVKDTEKLDSGRIVEIEDESTTTSPTTTNPTTTDPTTTNPTTTSPTTTNPTTTDPTTTNPTTTSPTTTNPTTTSPTTTNPTTTNPTTTNPTTTNPTTTNPTTTNPTTTNPTTTSPSTTNNIKEADIANSSSNLDSSKNIKLGKIKIKIAKKWKKGKKYKLYILAKINGKKVKISKKILKKYKLKIRWSLSSKKKAKLKGKKSAIAIVKMKKKGTVTIKCKIASKLTRKKLKRK